MEEFIVVSFNSTHEAIKSESVTIKENIPARLIPTPPEISAGCGLSLRAPFEIREKLKEALEKENVTSSGWFRMYRQDGKKTLEKWDV